MASRNVHRVNVNKALLYRDGMIAGYCTRPLEGFVADSYRKWHRVTVQTGSKLEEFFAAFSRKTRVQRRAVHAKRIGITARKRYMSTPFEGAWTVTASILAE